MPRWFRRKIFGYGWTPCSWQGWAVMAVFTACLVAVVRQIKTLGPASTFALAAALVVGLLAVTAFTSGRDSDS